MIYLAAYLSVGVLVLAAMLWANRHESESRWEKDFAAASRWNWLLLKGVVPLLAGVLAVLAWPYPVLWMLREYKGTRVTAARVKASRIVVKRAGLQHPMTIAEIEKLERVEDPLGAVPDLPFGHLNGAWKRFITNMSPSDSIRGFSKVWETQRGGRELRSGYAVLRGKKVRAHFVISRRQLDRM